MPVVARETQLVWRTPVGGQTLTAGTKILTATLPNAAIDVTPFPVIRITGNNRTVSTGNITYLLTHTIGNELFSQLDTITLTPGQQFSKVYEVPGIGLAIQVQTPAGATNTIDVAVFGHVD